jgi:iron complex outermembrane receptor protein
MCSPARAHPPSGRGSRPIIQVLTGGCAMLLLIAAARRGAWAEDPPAAAATPATAPATAGAEAPVPAPRYEEVVITGAPIPRTLSELAQPAAVVEGQELTFHQAPQLGEVLATQPGISQSYFGPGASRPVIRGLGGDNIRVVENGLSTFDASAVSPDHAISIEPLLASKIEVVRGPAALLYGPTAIGGVVNTLTNRIPDEPIDVPVRGAAEARGNSVNLERAGVAYLEGGYRNFAYHLDGFGRQTDDLSIPGFARSERLREQVPLPPGETEARGILPNSAIEADGGSGGLSYIGSAGYVGLAPSYYHTHYGTVAEPDVTIALHQLRLDFAGALNAPLPRITTIKAKLGLVDYDHTELEGAVEGTKFKNRGYDLRLDGLHEPLGPVEGAVGFESTFSDFSALGEEAFLPKTQTNVQSLFAFEELVRGAWRFQGAGRLDFQGSHAEADPQFGPASSRSFVTGGASFGGIYTIVEPYALAASVQYTQRPPNVEELYANGPHLATDQFEIGDRNLSPQQSIGVDVAIRRTAGRVTGSIGGFYDRFIDYIALLPNGQTNPQFNLPIFVFTNVAAYFVGTEAEGTVTVWEAGPHRVDLNAKADYVQAQDLSNHQALPYIPPFRFGIGGRYYWRVLQLGLSLFRAVPQYRVPEGQCSPDFPSACLPTDGYTLLNADGSYPLTVGPTHLNIFLRGANLLNQKAREAASVLKDVSPLPGVGVLGGVQIAF